MIQRVQTVFFFFAALFAAVPLLGTGLFTIKHDEVIRKMTVFGVTEPGNKDFFSRNDTWILCLVIIALLVFAILSFKHRKRQLTLAVLALALHILTAAWMVLGAFVEANACADCEQVSVESWGIPFFIFVLGVVPIILGIRGNRKDQKLIDSLDRLR